MVRREVAGELLVLDLATQRIHRLNETATRICRLYEEGCAVESIADALTAEFTVDRATALEDVKKTLTSLTSLDLFTRSGSDYPEANTPPIADAPHEPAPPTSETRKSS